MTSEEIEVQADPETDPEASRDRARLTELRQKLGWSMEQYAEHMHCKLATAYRDFKLRPDPLRLAHLELMYERELKPRLEAHGREEAFQHIWTPPYRSSLKRIVVATRVPLLQRSPEYAQATLDTLLNVDCEAVFAMRAGGEEFDSIQTFITYALDMGLADQEAKGRLRVVLLDRESTKYEPSPERLFFGGHRLATYAEYEDRYEGRWLLDVDLDSSRNGTGELMVPVSEAYARKVVQTLWSYLRTLPVDPFAEARGKTLREQIALKEVELPANWKGDPTSW